MITFDDIKLRLGALRYNGFKNVVVDFLRSFDIVESTISIIAQRIENNENEPIFLYRKAVILCTRDSSPYFFNQQCVPYKHDFPLILSFSPNGINVYYGETTFFSSYEDINKYADKFLTLICNERKPKDTYKTLDFGTLIASLFRSLKEDGNSQEDSITSVFNIVYISLFPITAFKDNVVYILNSMNYHSYTERVQALFILYRDNKYISQCNTISVNRDAFVYIRELLQYDSHDLDIEILSSIVYKLFDDKDASLYGHQTSFLNVRKVINPLLINDINQRIEDATNESLKDIARDILDITCIDPTNSPGCFLSAAILELMNSLEVIDSRLKTNYKQLLSPRNYVSIVDNPIAAQLSKLTISYCFIGGESTLDLKNINRIHSNLSVHLERALQVDWAHYSHNINNTYIFGSPRFLGAVKIKRIPIYKEDLSIVFASSKLGTRDYCSGWLVKAAKTIVNTNAKVAFVLTNSITQGAQVSEIWPFVYYYGCEIKFAYTSFKWKINERANIGISVVIVGLGVRSNGKKLLFQDGKIIKCDTIGPYLLPGSEIIVKESDRNLFGVLPLIRKGDMPYDNGNLLINDSRDLQKLVESDSRVSKFIKRISGSEEFINAIRRWCLWIPSAQALCEVSTIPIIMDRIEKVRKFRETSTATQKCKDNPHQFRENYVTSSGCQSLIIPSVSSENRNYIPIGFVNDKMIVSNLAFAVYDCDIWVFAIISSRMHMNWVRTVCGALETRYRYSKTLGYNTFPIPEISEIDKYILKMLVLQLIDIRERYCNISLGLLYNNMPDDLSHIHKLIDDKVDKLYQNYPFNNDFERISCLMNLYKDKIAQ